MATVFQWQEAISEEEVKPGMTQRVGKLLAHGKDIQLIRYDRAPGGVTPEHSHPEELIGIMIKGRQEAVINGERVTITAGIGYHVPANEKHGPFINVGDETCISLGILSPPRAFDPITKQ